MTASLEAGGWRAELDGLLARLGRGGGPAADRAAAFSPSRRCCRKARAIMARSAWWCSPRQP